jgi:hypothetical protein
VLGLVQQLDELNHESTIKSSLLHGRVLWLLKHLPELLVLTGFDLDFVSNQSAMLQYALKGVLERDFVARLIHY